MESEGTQTFTVLVPQELTPGSVTVESAGAHDANGKKLEELAVKSPDLEVDLFLDWGSASFASFPLPPTLKSSATNS